MNPSCHAARSGVLASFSVEAVKQEVDGRMCGGGENVCEAASLFFAEEAEA